MDPECYTFSHRAACARIDKAEIIPPPGMTPESR